VKYKYIVVMTIALMLFFLLPFQSQAYTQKEIRMNPNEKTKTIFDADGNYVVIEVMPDLQVVVKTNNTEKKYVIPDVEKLKLYAFADIKDHWAIDYIETMIDMGLLKGYPDGTFRPNNPISRAEFGAVLTRVLELENKGPLVTGANFFTDVNTKDWFYDDITKLQKRGNLQASIYHNILRPKEAITREEMALWLANEVEAGSNDANYSDNNNMKFSEQVKIISSQQLLKGYPDGRFRPTERTTRAETAALFVRYLELKGIKAIGGIQG